MAFALTQSQERAVSRRGKTILVSAGAGSGKTRVLTERLIRLVSDPDDPQDIDRFLVITYTRAAAAELKSRITEALALLCAERPNDRRLRRQQSLCCRAHIGTIHSFCADVVRENCHRLGLPPAFSVLEEDRASQLRENCLTRLLERHYGNIAREPDFRLLADTVGAGRDDRRLEQTVLSLHYRLRSQTDPDAWVREQKLALRAAGASDAGDTAWGRELVAEARLGVDFHLSRMESALREIAGDPTLQKAYGKSWTETTGALRDFRRALDQGWDRARAFSVVPFPRLGALKGYEDQEKKERLTAVRDACKKAMAALADSFASPSELLLTQLRDTAPAMDALLNLTLELDGSFSAEKRRRGVLDFGDLERYAAELLLDETGERPSAVGLSWSRRFREVMVDEYQDVSPIQDRIFRAVSREENNLFLVGDVKQSIYRFRLAEPGLFLDKYRRFTPTETAGEGEPERILLRENFRSRRPVIEAVNGVFSLLMSRELGELDYDSSAALVCGADYPPETDRPAELVLLPEDAPEGGDRGETEAGYIAGRILSMMASGATVHTPEGDRPAVWGDFALLLRSPAGRGPVFRRVLAERGIPVENALGGGFFSSLEVTVALDLLCLIDNPHADVPLIGVLRSPAFGFTADELSMIRAASPDTDFYTALRAAAAAGQSKCVSFLARLRSWRTVQAELTPEELLWRVCRETELFAICAAMGDGERRRENLFLLLEYARSFTAGGNRGVRRFAAWLRRMAEEGTEPARPDGEDAVHIMSIHRSKGLEFPFVFLCDLSHRFNQNDAYDAVAVHSDLGLGPKYVDIENRVEYPTLARLAVQSRLRRETLSEELRVLYVGMTRARERLIMTAAVKDPEAELDRLSRAEPVPPHPSLLRTAGSPGDWLRMAAGADKGKHFTVLAGGTDAASDGASGGVETSDQPIPAPAEDRDAAEFSYAALRARLDWRYPHPAEAGLPSRLTATEIKRAQEAAQRDAEAAELLPPETDGDVKDAPCAPERKEKAGSSAFRRPELGRPQRLTAAEKGTAAHRFLQHLDLSRTGSVEELRRQGRELAQSGLLTAQERSAVDYAAVQRLFASPLGQEMVRAGEKLRREFRFTLLAEARDYFPEAEAGERLLLQGVVDCFFLHDGAVTLVDYKTDRVTAQEAQERAERYRTQLDTYTKALERILKKPVDRAILWFLYPGTAVELRDN
ncbi:MAG: helicase-exonuclease AddAB subunit AddA [Oscillospiraceae bacterium]|nr:helicase-exonuclease AddAB subunit AddA [Oscillospiraceae bacterium]